MLCERTTMKTGLVYVGAAIAEIAGCFAFWGWLRLGKPVWWLFPGILSLIAFAYLLTLVESEAAGRAYATYGGIYIVASLCLAVGGRECSSGSLGCCGRFDVSYRRGRYTLGPARVAPVCSTRAPSRKTLQTEKGRLVSQTAFPVLRQPHISGRFQNLCTGGLFPGRVLIGDRCKSGQSRTGSRHRRDGFPSP